jgi:hypothetical protein
MGFAKKPDITLKTTSGKTAAELAEVVDPAIAQLIK